MGTRYYNYELVCRKCGKTINRRMSQFDSLPDCIKCGNEMLVANATGGNVISDDVNTVKKGK